MNPLTLCLTGDVMLGRGIDQILPNPADPTLNERNVQSAKRYVKLAEDAHGSIPRPVSYSYPWGIALEEVDQRSPDATIINLETSVTRSDEFWDGKGIHYRMSPENIPTLSAANVDVCVFSNNHVLDFGPAGLNETLTTLEKNSFETTGAGRNRTHARQPAAHSLNKEGRILVFGVGTQSSGIPPSWRADEQSPGVCLLDSISSATAESLAERIEEQRKPGDLVIVSVHWGGNWSYEIPDHQRSFARRLIESEQVDLIHGHSSHHVKGIEVHQGHLILYGCGDLINDYEGIQGRSGFRDDLGLLYFPVLDGSTGRLEKMTMVPTRLQKFALQRPGPDDREWLRSILDRESQPLGPRVTSSDATLKLNW